MNRGRAVYERIVRCRGEDLGWRPGFYVCRMAVRIGSRDFDYLAGPFGEETDAIREIARRKGVAVDTELCELVDKRDDSHIPLQEVAKR